MLDAGLDSLVNQIKYQICDNALKQLIRHRKTLKFILSLGNIYEQRSGHVMKGMYEFIPCFWGEEDG